MSGGEERARGVPAKLQHLAYDRQRTAEDSRLGTRSRHCGVVSSCVTRCRGPLVSPRGLERLRPDFMQHSPAACSVGPCCRGAREHSGPGVGRKAGGKAFVVPFDTPATRTDRGLTNRRMGEAARGGYSLPRGFAKGGEL